MSALLILKMLWPLAMDLAAATRKDSDGGKKVTMDELGAIMLEHLPKVAKKVHRQIEKPD